MLILLGCTTGILEICVKSLEKQIAQTSQKNKH